MNSPLPLSQYYPVYRQSSAYEADLCQSLFLRPGFEYRHHLAELKMLCRVHDTHIDTERRRVIGFIEESERRIDRNYAPSIMIPEGGIITLMSMDQYREFLRDRLVEATRKPCHVERGLYSIAFKSVTLEPECEHVVVIANTPVTLDTAMVSRREIAQAVSSLMGNQPIPNMWVDSSSCTCGLSMNPMIRFELYAQRCLRPGEAVCGQAMIPFGQHSGLDQVWLDCSSYYRMMHEGMEYRPSMLNPRTGEVHSHLWMANDACAPCPTADSGCNCELLLLDDVSTFLRGFPCIGPEYHQGQGCDDLSDYPEAQELVNCVLRGDVQGQHRVTQGWVFYILASTQSIPKGSPLRFSYGLYSHADNQKTSYRKKGVNMDTPPLVMFCDSTRPYPERCKLFDCTSIASADESLGGEGAFPVMASHRWQIQQSGACIFRGGRTGQLEPGW